MEHHKPDARTQQGEAVNASDKPLKATGHDMDRNCAAAGWVGSSKTIAVATGKAPTHHGQAPNTRVRLDLLVVLLEREAQLTQKGTALLIVHSGGHHSDVHTARAVNLVNVNLVEMVCSVKPKV